MPAGPIIVLVGSGVFLFSVLLAPRRGVLGRAISAWRFRRELQERRLLRLLFDRIEPGLPAVRLIDRSELVGRRGGHSAGITPALGRLAGRGEIVLERDREGRVRLTDSGLRRARSVVRGQRLWEQFLHDYPEQTSAMADLSRESVDDVLPPDVVAELESALRDAGRWPDPGRGERTP
jgi:manganese/zinc/iron transport system permease protein